MLPVRRHLKSALQGSLRPLLQKLRPRRTDLPPSTWRLERHTTGALTLDGERLDELVRRHGSPLFVADMTRLESNASAFLRAPPGARGGVEPYYSYKTNPVPAVLQRLHAAGVGAEVISEYEFWLARRLGVPGDRIVLNGPARTPQVLRSAIELGSLVQVNHREELPLLTELSRSVGKRCRVGLRVVPSGGWGGQFGEPIGSGAALTCYRAMLATPELDVVSLHAHLGGELSSESAARAFASEILDFDGVLRRELGLCVKILDLGGSLACPTTSHYSNRELRLNRGFGTDLVPRDPGSVLDIERYVSVLVSMVEERVQLENRERPRIFVEPGRALTGNAQFLLCRVIGLKESGADGVVHAILDAGVNIAEPMRGEYHQIFLAGPARQGERDYRLVGPICTPMDTLAWSWRLPRLEVGDVLAFMDAGAYFVPFSTSFSFPQPAVVLVDGGKTLVARRAEEFEDLVRRDVGLLPGANQAPT
jgi:diaminopimelate decarboxylase